jgi:aspartate aminotransferase
MIDVAAQFRDCEDLAARAPNQLANGLKGSSILAIARQVKALQAEGQTIADLTIGDFDPKHFPIPDALTERIRYEVGRGQTNYPPAVGVPELRSAIRALYARELGLQYPDGCVQVGSGARPPIFATFGTLVNPGDIVVYPVPSWNVNHYCFMAGAKGVPLVTSPDNGFMPTAAQILPHLPTANLLVINTPQNPSGTTIGAEQLREVCEAIIAENRGRRERGERPLMLMYDQVYWQLTFGGYNHVNPVSLVPEMARYTVFVDAISKCWAATGLRVGWAVVPPWVGEKMQALVGHMGAWAAKPEQLATAALLADPSLLGDYMPKFIGGVQERLGLLQAGFEGLAAAGHPVGCLPAQGAIYLSARLNLFGKTRPNGQVISSDEDIRNWLLEACGIAVVPFTAFGYPANSGWVRLSVGAVSVDDVKSGIERLTVALGELR